MVYNDALVVDHEWDDLAEMETKKTVSRQHSILHTQRRANRRVDAAWVYSCQPRHCISLTLHSSH